MALIVPSIFAQDIETAYQQIQAEPLEVAIGENGETVLVDGPRFAVGIFDRMYAGAYIAFVPLVINAVANNTVDETSAAILLGFLPREGIAWLMHYSVTCSEDPPSSVADAQSLDEPG